MSESLYEYQQKRDFERTSEPRPGEKAGAGPLTFVVQKHRARRLHYDFRLELDGVLKSWAVPKGPSLDPDQKRLAAMVEDHPIDYGAFEGIIPAGEYGAGEVIVWDGGTYSPDEGGQLHFEDREAAQAQMRQGLEKGKLSFFLRGSKLKGSWTLVKTRRSEKDWLLIKHRDDYVRSGFDVLGDERSVLSGRTVEDVKAGVRPEATRKAPPTPGRVPGATEAAFPGFIPPMLAANADVPFSHPDWVFEPKLDGYRIIATLRNGAVDLWSRRGMNVTEKYGAIIPSLAIQPVSGAILDGEMVAMDDMGKVCFQSLQQYLKTLGVANDRPQTPLIYYVFDILYLDGYDLTGAALEQRKEVLRGILRPSGEVRLVDHFGVEGKTVFEAAIANGLEGVVAKRSGSSYESGRRSGAWLKVKAVRTDDFVIAGYTAGEGSRSGSFGALLLGYHDEKARLVFAGHVGSGFDDGELVPLRAKLDAIRTDACPFAVVPETNSPPTWVRPELVGEVRYSQWTDDGRLRTPVFLRLREDKTPAEVRRVRGVPAPAPEDGIGRAVAAPPGGGGPNGPPSADGMPSPVSTGQTGTEDRLLAQLTNPKGSFGFEVESKRIGLTNVDKVLWPATDQHGPVTKRDFLNYLVRVSPYLLAHLKDRPITLSRYPDGISGEHFWQKHWSHPIPEFVDTLDIAGEKGKSGRYMMCNNVSTLMWLGQLADIEFHTWFSRVNPEPDMGEERDDHPPFRGAKRGSNLVPSNVDRLLDHPDFIIFDLDPYLYSGTEAAGAEPELNKAAFDKACEVALGLKRLLDSLSLTGFIKTSGKTGLHIYVPIVRNLDYRQARRAAETLGRFLMQKHADDMTMEWSSERRRGKVFLDYAQNVRGKTLASVYSPRPHPEATVSTPLRWDELGKVYPTDFTILTIHKRLAQTGDLWADMLKAKKDLADVLGV